MGRPRKHSDEELTAVAARVIAARGPQELTLAEVAREAGIAPATLVQRFGSKRGLLLAVAASAPDVIADAFQVARDRTRTPLRALESALVDLASMVSDPDEVANHLAFLALDLGDPEFREHAARDTGAMRTAIDGLLGEAVAAGELDAASRRPLAELLQAVYHGTLLMWAIERRGRAAERVRRHVRVALQPHVAPSRGN